MQKELAKYFFMNLPYCKCEWTDELHYKMNVSLITGNHSQIL